MKRLISFTIPLDPEPWSRAGVNFKARRFYDRQRHEKIAIGLYMRNAIGAQPMLEGPLQLETQFYFKKPKSPKYRNLIWYDKRPDLDNLEKLLCDAAQGILFEDDCLICENINGKYYTDNEAYTFVQIRELI